MCGIVGYIGEENTKAKCIILDGLKCLEYRGYDSAGIAMVKNSKILLRKESGMLDKLIARTRLASFDSNIGIGHTRWATHGSPIRENAHPHISFDGRITLVHNGIIENYQELREMLKTKHNIAFKSATDSEALAHLIALNYTGDLLEAVKAATKLVRGSYAIGVLSTENSKELVAARRNAPLIAGIGKNCNYLASDAPALLKHTRDVYVIEDNEYVVLTKDDIRIEDSEGIRLHRQAMHIDWDATAAEKGGFEHFMLKEMFEQPGSVEATLNQRTTPEGQIKLDGVKFTKKELDGINRIYIVACGTAYHAGVVGKNIIEKYAKIPVEVEVASEFRYKDPFVDEKTLIIAISQSGETSDTLEGMREARRRGARILSVVNVVGSSVARESDDVLYTWAGPEIAVASTKAYITQLVCMYLIALFMGQTKGLISQEKAKDVIGELKLIPGKISEILADEASYISLAKSLYKKEQVFFIGRGMDVATSLEGSLKLKEISYINSFAIQAGELKHGTIALINRGTLFFALATQDYVHDKMISNIEEIRARKAYVVAFSKKGDSGIENVSDVVCYIPSTSDELAPLLSIIPLQLLAYHIAKLRGREIDKPRNLAKSVTVE